MANNNRTTTAIDVFAWHEIISACQERQISHESLVKAFGLVRTSPVTQLGRSRPAADATREVTQGWLLDGVDVSVGHRRCSCDPSSQKDAGRTPASQLRTKYHTSLRSHSRRFCSTLQLFPGSLRPSTRSRISGGVVSERKIFRHSNATFGSTAFFLRQDATQSLEPCRYSLSEKDTSPADGS